MRRNLLIAVCLVGISMSPVLQAQFLQRLVNPTVTVALEHPPAVSLQISALAFGPSKGECSEALQDRIEVDFTNSNMTVVDRAHLDDVLQEHKLQVSGLVDEETATQVGEMLGAQALVFVTVRHCDVDRSTKRLTCYKGKTQYPCTKYRTQADINGSLRIEDLRTGRFLAAQPFDGSSSAEDWNGYPDSDEQLQKAEVEIVNQIHKMFFPWPETRKLVFFNDKDCNLKTAFQLLRGGDVEGARRTSVDNLEMCRTASGVKPKTLAHAYYNVGMIDFIRRDYDDAQDNFRHAMSLKGGEIVSSAMADCHRAQQLATQMDQYEEDQSAVVAELSSAGSGGGVAAKDDHSSETMGSSSTAERLRKLESLLKQGLITQQEYDQKRAAILADI